MDPVLLSQLARIAIRTAGTALVTHGAITASQETAAETSLQTIGGALMFLVPLAWTIYRHYRPTPAIVASVTTNAAATAAK